MIKDIFFKSSNYKLWLEKPTYGDFFVSLHTVNILHTYYFSHTSHTPKFTRLLVSQI